MRGSGLIIRLIDIVMILLLGFLNISDIIHKDEIKLPSKKKTSTKPTDKDQLRLRIKIIPSDTTIDSLKQDTYSTKYAFLSQQLVYYQVQEGEKSYRIRSLLKLEDELYRIKSENKSLLIIIQPDSNSAVQGTVNLIDFCRKYNLKRMFDYNYPK